MIRFQDRSRHIQLESGFSTQTASSLATHFLYIAAIQFANRFPTLSRSLTGGESPGRPAGKALLRIGGVTAIDREEQGGPPPTTENAPASMRSSTVWRRAARRRSSSGWWSTSTHSTHGHPRLIRSFSHLLEPANRERAPGPPEWEIDVSQAFEKMNASAGKFDRAGNFASSTSR